MILFRKFYILLLDKINMNEADIKRIFKDKLRQREQSLKSLGYILAVREVPANPDGEEFPGQILDHLLRKEMGRKEYVVLPNDPEGSSHRIYAKNII